MDRIDGVAALEELINGGSLIGFDRDRQMGPGCHLLAKALPPSLRVFEFKVGDDLSLGVDDHDRVVIPSPVEAAVVRDFFPGFHEKSFP